MPIRTSKLLVVAAVTVVVHHEAARTIRWIHAFALATKYRPHFSHLIDSRYKRVAREQRDLAVFVNAHAGLNLLAVTVGLLVSRVL
jgi:hypothetical protein